MTKRFLNKNERRFERGDLENTDVSVTWRIISGHLPQTQEEEEGDEQSHHGDAVTQEVYDHSDLVVHLPFFLQETQEQKQ